MLILETGSLVYFVFVLVSNLSGLLGLRAPTADFCTTAAITLATFVMIHFMGIKTGKGGYFKGYLEPSTCTFAYKYYK